MEIKTEGKLQHCWLIDAVVHPFKNPVHPAFAGGLELPDGPEFDVLRHHRTRRPVDRKPDHGGAAPKVLRGDYLYAGPLIPEFGHFMSESIHRILSGVSKRPGIQLLFAAGRGQSTPSLETPYIQQTLEFLKIPLERITIATQPVQVECLLVAEQGSDLGGGPKAPYLDMLDRFSTRRLDEFGPWEGSPTDIYVSRSTMPSGCLLGEGYFEQCMERAGYRTYHPEKYPLTHQMNTYRHARRIVFSEGSSCHAAELLGRNLQFAALLNRRVPAKLNIFRAVVQPRAQKYADFRKNHYVGALPVGTPRPPLPHVGISVFNPTLLIDFLTDSGLVDARLQFDLRAYTEAVWRDFQRYVDWAMTHPRTVVEDVVNATPELRAQLESELRSLK